MESLKIKNDVMTKLGTGLSVASLCVACNISYEQLCSLAYEYPELYHELKKWYKRYDFTPTVQQPIENKKKITRKSKETEE